MSSASIPAAGTNLSIIVGTLRRPPEERLLPAGELVLALELTVRREGGPADSVPVSWVGAPPSAGTWSAGEELLVVGRVQRRFFRASGATQSRTEVVATRAVPTRRAAAAAKALQAAVDSLGPATVG